jgi:hypothetical protein
MPRKTYAQLLTEVTAAITAAGGEITHADLVDQVNRAAALELNRMKSNGDIVARLVARPDAAALLTYSLPTDTPAEPVIVGGE